MKHLFLIASLLLSGCITLPQNVQPVGNFKLERYLGTWHEIARLDHSFERGLSQVTAEYSMRADGGVRVLNRGYSAEDKQWKESKGKAYFMGKPDQGYLKVSFFGPFYGAYAIAELDHENYQYAMVTGPNKSYLWILARTPTLDATTKDHLIEKAAALGFKTNGLIFVDHNQTGQ